MLQNAAVKPHSNREFAGTRDGVRELAQFFPTAIAVRLPVRVEREGDGTSEQTVVEFATAQEVIFASAMMVEFGDCLHVTNEDGTLDAEVTVVALHYQGGRTAIAARFIHKVPHWIVKG